MSQYIILYLEESEDSEDNELENGNMKKVDGGSSSGPPPPPPPPPPAMVSSKGEDGISHMSMMAKSRMHEELVKKANARHLGTQEYSSSATTHPENSSSMRIESFASSKLSKITSEVEPKVQGQIEDRDKLLDPDSDYSSHSHLAETICLKSKKESSSNLTFELPGTVEEPTIKPMPKPKLYDSIFADKTLSEKEKLRREFLFGRSKDKSSTLPQLYPSPELPAVSHESPKIPLKSPEKDVAFPLQKVKEPENLVKNKQCCSCQIL